MNLVPSETHTRTFSPTIGVHEHHEISGSYHTQAQIQPQPYRFEVEIRQRHVAPERHADALARSPTPASAQPDRKRSTSKLGSLASDCCSAASVNTPNVKHNSKALIQDSVAMGVEWGRQHADDINAILGGYRPSGESGLGLRFAEQLSSVSKAVDHDVRPATAFSRKASVKTPVPPSDVKPTPLGISKTKQQGQSPALPSVPFTFPYQSLPQAENSVLSLTTEHPNDSTLSLARVETQQTANSKVHGLAGAPEAATSLLQRRACRPLELGLFQSEAQRQDAVNARAAVSGGKRLHNSASLPSIVPGPKSPGALRSPPPFPPPSMPLPAIPHGLVNVPSPNLLHTAKLGDNSRMVYGKHSPVGSASSLIKLDAAEQGRSRSASLDTPAAKAHLHLPSVPSVPPGRRGLDLSAGCTFTPLDAFNASRAPARAADRPPPVPERPPQIDLSFLTDALPSSNGHAEMELGNLGRLRTEMQTYGRSSLDQSSPRPANSMPNTLKHRGSPSVPFVSSHRANTGPDAASPSRARQFVSPPSSPPSNYNVTVARSDSRGRRSSISMLPYKHEPSWSISSQSSPTQEQRELQLQQHTDRQAPVHGSISSLRHMAAFISAGSPRHVAPGTGHVAMSSGGSMSSRETSPIIPMLLSSSVAGSSASTNSYDGPHTPADSISERFQAAEAMGNSSNRRRSGSSPRILFLGSQDVPTGYEHIMRGRMDAMGLAAASAETKKPSSDAAKEGRAAAAVGSGGAAVASPPPPALPQRSNLRAVVTATAAQGLGPASSPNNLSPIPGSSPGSYETHSTSTARAVGFNSARSSDVPTSDHSVLGGGHAAVVPTPVETRPPHREPYFSVYPTSANPTHSELVPIQHPLQDPAGQLRGPATTTPRLGMGRPSHQTAAPHTHLRSVSSASDLDSKLATTASIQGAGAASPSTPLRSVGSFTTSPSPLSLRKTSRSSRHLTSSFHRDDELEHTSVYGMAM